MTEAHHEHAVVVALSNAWYDRDRELWYVGLELSKALGRTLLASIYVHLSEVRDDVAREAFERRVSIGEVARERLAKLRPPQTNYEIKADVTARNQAREDRIGADGAMVVCK